MVVSNIFYVHPYLGKIPILTNIFHMAWNHQLDTHLIHIPWLATILFLLSGPWKFLSVKFLLNVGGSIQLNLWNTCVLFWANSKILGMDIFTYIDIL